jgi:hypothetical protein
LIVRLPASSELVAKLAVPPLNGTAARVVVPDVKVIISPSGIGPKVELMLAVKATRSPTNEGDGDEEMVMTVFAGNSLTVSISPSEPLAAKLEFPE